MTHHNNKKSSYTLFDPADFYGGLNLFEIDSAIIFFSKIAKYI